MDLTDLYREVILDHNKSPRNFGRLDPADAAARGHNPLCGDQLQLTLRLTGDRIGELAFDGHGCAISVASASLMTEAIKGHTRAEAEALYHEMHQLLTDSNYQPTRDLGKLMALAGVREFPARVKCASLCWHTLDAALKQFDSEAATRAAAAGVAVVSTE